MALVELQRDEALAVLTINNPPVNAFSADLAEEFRAAVSEVARSDARALLTRAEGANFCAGADVNIFVGLDRRSGAGLTAEVLTLISMIETLPIPTMVAVQGLCLAAGMEIMLAHDLAWAGEGALIGQVEAKIGTTTLAGGAQRIAARAGVARAKQMVFDGNPIDAATLERWNIINRVAPDAELDAKSRRYAKRLSEGPTAALAVGKAVIDAGAQTAIAASDRTLLASTGPLFESEDMRGSVTQFLAEGSKSLLTPKKFEGR